MSRFAWAVVLALMLVAGMVGYALADIPDARPSTVDPTHTVHWCVRQGTGPMHAVNAFDETQAAGKTCGQVAAGWDDLYTAPVIPAP